MHFGREWGANRKILRVLLMRYYYLRNKILRIEVIMRILNMWMIQIITQATTRNSLDLLPRTEIKFYGWHFESAARNAIQIQKYSE